MHDDVKKFVASLVAPMPPQAAREYAKLCMEAFAERSADGQDPASSETDGPFDQVFHEACKLRRAQRLRLITSLVNHEVLVQRLARDQ